MSAEHRARARRWLERRLAEGEAQRAAEREALSRAETPEPIRVDLFPGQRVALDTGHSAAP